MIYRLIAMLAAVTAISLGLFLSPTFSFELSKTPEARTYSVKPADQNMVCPGALIRSGGATGTVIGKLDRTGQAELNLSFEGEGTVELLTLDGGSADELESNSSRQESTLSISETTSLTASNRSVSQQQGSKVLTGSQTQSVGLDTLSGFASASCSKPESEFWIVGGSTVAGREALLILSNPSRIDATADLKIFTDLGELQVAGLSGISVLRESTTVISLASFAPSVGELAVKVSAEGAKLAGWIQQRAIRGTSAQGVDYVSSQLVSANTFVIPGLVVSGAGELEKLKELGEEYADVGHALRIYAPEGAVFTAQVISSDSDGFGAVLSSEVSPGTVADFPIDELLNGSYSVYVSSDKPVFASVRSSVASKSGTPKTDFAWLAPALEITGERVFTVGGNVAILTLANQDSDSVSVSIKNLSTGKVENVSVPSQGSVSAEVTGTVLLSSKQSFFATLTILKGNGVSDSEILDPKNIGSEVQVLFR